jgi:hypothetical protein
MRKSDIPAHGFHAEEGREMRSGEYRIIHKTRPVVQDRLGCVTLPKSPILSAKPGLTISAGNKIELFKRIERRIVRVTGPYKLTEGITFDEVRKSLEESDSGFMWSLAEMERTRGEPYVFEFDDNRIVFVDFSAESPLDRRGYAYDECVKEAERMGTIIVPKGVYFKMQERGEFDLYSQVWISTPPDIIKNDKAFVANRNPEEKEKDKQIAFEEDDSNSKAGLLSCRMMLEIPRV